MRKDNSIRVFCHLHGQLHILKGSHETRKPAFCNNRSVNKYPKRQEKTKFKQVGFAWNTSWHARRTPLLSQWGRFMLTVPRTMEEPKVANKHKERPLIPCHWEIMTDYEICPCAESKQNWNFTCGLPLKEDGKNELGQAFCQNTKSRQKQGIGGFLKR